MLYVIKTQSPDSDLFFLRYRVLPELKGKYTVRRNYYCDIDTSFEQFLNNTGTLSLFATDKTLHVLYDLKTNKKEIDVLSKLTDELIILMNPSKKTFTKSSSVQIIDTPFTLNDIKKLIQQQLSKESIPKNISIDDIVKKIAFADDMGNINYSPLQAEILIKQLQLLAEKSPDSIASFIKSDKEFADHWQMISQLFAEKNARNSYFENLMEMFDIYEIVNSLKNSIILIGVISNALEQHTDATSIAKTLGKHPFYVQNLVRTIHQHHISPTKAANLLSRFLNLELKLKSGELDDAELGFQILIATLD